MAGLFIFSRETSVQRIAPQTVTRFESHFGKHDGANHLAYRVTVLVD